MNEINLPLMSNNIDQSDREVLINFLKEDHILTNSKMVRTFESEWNKWVGLKHSIFVNSGASANVLSMAALRHLYGPGEIIVPPLTWVSDISSVLHAGLKPVFVDIDPKTLAMDIKEIKKAVNSKTLAIFLTHILGFNGLNQELLDLCKERNILLIEDVCESHGATFNNKKLGSFGFASNFSYYYAHHMTTIEGGMICTNDDRFYETCRMLRSHGMVRECDNNEIRESYKNEYPDLNPDFIFSFASYNMRSTELNAVLGLNQLKKLDNNNIKRTKNMTLFYSLLDAKKYRTDFAFEGSSNYAFVLIMKTKDEAFRGRLENTLRKAKVEFRRGTSGGGNQLRQPYLRKLFANNYFEGFPEVEHVHFFGYYIGNYPDLEEEKIRALCQLLNECN